MPLLSSCRGFSPCWNYVVGILISTSATAQPGSGSHWSLSAESLPCSFSDVSHYSGPAPFLMSCVLLWVALIKSYPALDLWIYFVAWPQTCHITMNSPDNLDPLLTLATISEPVLLIFLGQCGIWALPCQSCIMLNSWLPFLQGTASPHSTLKHLAKALLPLLFFQMTRFRLQENSNYLCYISKTWFQSHFCIKYCIDFIAEYFNDW